MSPGERAASDRTRILLKVNNAIVSHLDLAQVLNAVSACVRREAKVLCRLERAVPLPSKDAYVVRAGVYSQAELPLAVVISQPCASGMSQGWKPTNPERWRKATLPKLHKISVVETWRRSPYAFHLLRLVRERGKSFSYHKHIVWRITLRLGRLRTPERPRSNPVGLIRFSRADPSGSSGQDKARIGENRASAIRIVGTHQIYR